MEICWSDFKCFNVKFYVSAFVGLIKYEGRLISNAHSEISRKRYHVFKQTAVEEGCGYKDTLQAHRYFAPLAKYFTVCLTYQPLFVVLL